MKKLMIALFLFCLLAGFIQAQPEGSGDSQGILKLPEGLSLKLYNSDKQGFDVHSEPAGTCLPYGDYTVEAWEYGKADADGKKWQIHGFPSKTMRFTIGDQPAVLDITPEPISATVQVYGADDYGFSLKLTGPADERYYLYCDGKRAAAPKLEITNADKSFNVTLSSSYG